MPKKSLKLWKETNQNNNMKKQFNSKMDEPTPEWFAKVRQLKSYPVSPYFTSRVLARAGALNNTSVWDYLQVYTTKNLRSALVALLILIVVALTVPTSNDEYQTNTNTNDYSFLMQGNGTASVQDLTTNDQALLFALSN